MPVPEQTPVSTFIGNGVTTIFPFAWGAGAASHIVVEVDGVAIVQGVDYTVSALTGTSGEVTITPAPANLAAITVFRRSPLERSIDYQENGPLQAETVDRDFDNVWRALQDMARRMTLAPALPNGSPLSGLVALPTPGAGKFLRWNDAGDNLEATDVAALGTAISDLGKVLIADATSEDMLTTLAPKRAEAGAVRVPVLSKLRERVSVIDFGAVGDGITDDTAAFQHALAALNVVSPFGAMLCVPAGVYRLTATLDIPTYVSIEGDGRWNTRLMFEGAIGVCINLAGADTGDKRQSVLSRMRIDGTKCTGASAVGVLCNWNQSQSPLLDEVTIYGGYEAEGAGTGLSTGLAFVANGNNWIVDFNAVAVEGCRTTSLAIDASPAGYANIINFVTSRFENCRGRNLYIKGPGDSVSSLSISFVGCTIEGASFQTTGVNEDVLVDGAGVNFNSCWFESHGTPNWPVYEINMLGAAWVSFHSCNWAWSNYAVNVRGRVTFSGMNTIRSNSGGIIVADGGRLTLTGDVAFLGAGVPIQSNDATGILDWSRDAHAPKTSTGAIPTSDFGATVSNAGAKAGITLTLPNGVSGATLRIVNAALSLRNAAFEWRLSAGGTGEYYLVAAGGGNPGVSKPTKLYAYGAEITEGTPGSLGTPRWGYGNNDALGFSTIYYKDGGGDPDSFSADTIMASYPVTVAPSNSQRIVPLGTSSADSIVSDGIPGSSIKLRCVDKSWWLIEDRIGAWT